MLLVLLLSVFLLRVPGGPILGALHDVDEMFENELVYGLLFFVAALAAQRVDRHQLQEMGSAPQA